MAKGLASLMIVFGCQSDQLTKSLKDIRTQTSALGKDLATVFGNLIIALSIGAGVAGLVGLLKSTSEWADKLSTLSQRTGISTEFLQRFDYAAKLTGITIDDVTQGVKYMQVALTGTGEGSAVANAAFQRLGLSYAVLRDLSPSQQLETILVQLRNIPDPAKRAALAIDIFGRSGTALLPMSNTIEKLMRDAPVLSQAQLDGATKAAEAIKKLGIAWEDLGKTFAVAILPDLVPLLNDLNSVIKAMSSIQQTFDAWAKEGLASGRGPLQRFMNRDFPGMPQFPLGVTRAFATGGIVNSPTLALIGEAGPEAVIPLNGAGSMGITNNFSGPWVIREEADVPKIARELYRLQQLRGNYA